MIADVIELKELSLNRDAYIPGTSRCITERDLGKNIHVKFEASQLDQKSCKLCGKNVANLKKHMKSHYPDKYQCHICMISLTRSDNLKRHIKLKHGIRDGSLATFMQMETKHFLANQVASYMT